MFSAVVMTEGCPREPTGTAHSTMHAVRSRMPLGSGPAVEPITEEPHDGVVREASVESRRAEATGSMEGTPRPNDIHPS